MGAKISNLMKKGAGDGDSEQEEIARKYEMKIESDGTFGYSDELDKREIRWWERILYDKRFRIVYVLILAIVLGIFIPLIIFKYKLQSNDRTIYGSCLIQENARFQCLINSEAIEDETSCLRALCCWENSAKLPYKCYHSFPSAYQYTVSDMKVGSANGTEWTDLTMTANQNVMSRLQARVRWETAEHLFVEFFNPSLTTPDAVTVPDQNTNNSTKINNTLPFIVEWGDMNNFFFFRVARRGTEETLFDTRLGPVISTKDYVTISTVLPTPYFYGLRGGQGSLSTLTYGVVNGFENAELPFYISSEASGMWHGVLIDTADPMLVQIVQAPGIVFYLETQLPKVKLHFFSGPTQPEILSQLHSYVRRKYEIAHPPPIPPYWGLGLHLCRKVENTTVVLKHLKELEGVSYDSDCIDENLRRPFSVDETNFYNLTEVLDLLETNSKRIILSQQVTVPWNNNNEDLPLIMDTSNSSQITVFKGTVDNKTVKYIDVFNSNFTQFSLPSNISFNGMSLTDNFPKLNNASEICSPPQSRIQALFTAPVSNSNSSVNASLLWGSVCSEASHITNTSGTAKYQSHLGLHNAYGHESLKILHETIQSHLNGSTNDTLLTSTSFWIGSMYFGGFKGLQVPFTWRGLQDSVAYTVRNYALAPIIGTPICGSPIFNLSLPANNDLCLRWFQFGLLLPLTMNSYDGNSSYGPNHLSRQYKGYLQEAIRQRYTFAPYYFTTLKQYQTEFVPFLRPMSFAFDSNRERNATFPILNQFMIGDAIMAAPIIDRGVSRTAYFPAGVWYTKEGLEAWNLPTSGSLKSITGLIADTPLFIRGGHIVPTSDIKYNSNYNKIEETLSMNYILLIALGPEDINGIQSAQGSLTVKASNNQFHELTFLASFHNETLKIVQNSTCVDNHEDSKEMSTTVDQFRIFGFPMAESLELTVMTLTSNHTVPECNLDSNPKCTYYGDHNTLRISFLNMDWCSFDHFEVHVKRINST